jgi:hypothetical protein
MEPNHVAIVLTTKRAELAGELIAAENRIVQLRADLENLDGAIRVFDPLASPADGKPKFTRLRLTPLPHGQASRQIMDILRTSRTPLISSEIADRLSAKCGMTNPTPAQRKAMVVKVRNMLARADGKTVVGEWRGKVKVWRLA